MPDSETPALKAAQDRVKRLLVSLEKAEAQAREAEARARDAEARALAAKTRPTPRALARHIADSLPRRANRGDSTRTLCLLLALDEGALSVNGLRTLLGIAQASASDWVREAMKQGIVESVSAKGDKRSHLIQLTAKGRVWARDRRSALAAQSAPAPEPIDEVVSEPVDETHEEIPEESQDEES